MAVAARHAATFSCQNPKYESGKYNTERSNGYSKSILGRIDSAIRGDSDDERRSDGVFESALGPEKGRT